MSTTLILIASRTSARFYTRHGMTKILTCVEEINNPEGRLQESELKSDRQGSNQDSVVIHGYSPHQTGVDRVSENFAREVAKTLNAKLNESSYVNCYLVAEPNFLGKLRAQMSKQDLLRCETIAKDFAPLSQTEIADRLPLEKERMEPARN